MIVKAAVKIYDYKQEKEIVIPCHRHCDTYYILKEFGYSWSDYDKIDEGFLDENETYYNRVEAYKHAWRHHQLKEEYKVRELYSEDLY